jgi:adenylate kinase family enzyme
MYSNHFFSPFLTKRSIFISIKAMKKSGKDNFLIDGFPRNKDNVDGWKQAMDDKVNIQCVLFFDCDEKVNIIILFFIYFY